AAMPRDARMRSRDARVVDDVGRLGAAAEDHRQARAGVDAVLIEPDKPDPFGLRGQWSDVAEGRRSRVTEAAHGFEQVDMHRLDAAAQLHAVQAAKALVL